MIIEGSATADVYESVLQSLSHSSSGEFTIGGERTLDIVVTDDQGADSNSATASVTVDAKDWSFNEDDLVDEAGNQIIGHWKPVGSSDSASMTKVVMNFGGKDYTRETPINEAGDFKITIEDTGGTPPIPVMGIIYFRADGTIELEPTEAINFMPEGMDLNASFTYTIEDGGSITTHKFGMDVSGQNDAPELTLDDSGDPQTIEVTDADAGATITKATITLKNSEAGDELSVNLNGTNLTAKYVNGVLIIEGSATADVYESVLQSLSHSSSGEFTIGGERTLDIVVTDDQGADSNSATASVTVDAKDWSFNEDDLVDEAGNQIIGHWKPVGSSDSASMTKVVMNFGGKDYTRETPINEAGDFKITIEDTGGTPPIPVMGIIYFRADGTIELEPTEAINFMPEGMDLSASFTYTVDDGGSITTHKFGMDVSGQNDAPVLSLEEGDGLLGKISIKDIDAGSAVSKAVVSITNGEAGDKLSVNLDGTTGLSYEYVNGVLTISGNASADIYQKVLDSLTLGSDGKFIVGSERSLNAVITDDKGTDSNNATASVTVNAKDWSFNEDDLVVEAGNQIIGHWKPAGSSDGASMTKVVMNFGGKDYTRVTPINEAGDFKITIEDTGGTPPIPVMGIIYFRADGTIELEPTEAINFMPEGMDLNASFTYTIEDGGSITTHKFGMDVSGQNDAPELTLDDSGDPQTIEVTDADAGSTITKATITLKNGEAGDELSVNLNGTNLTAKYVNGVLIIEGSATADVYESVLQSLSHSSSGEFTIGGERTLDIVVTDDQGTDSNSAAASVTVDAKDWSFNEDDLVNEAGNQIIGHWKPAGSSDSATMSEVVMRFGGKDYTRVTPINEAGDFKITIEDTGGTPPIPVMGIIYFRADGTIELEPTEAIDFMPEGMDLSASFTYTVDDDGSITTHKFGMDVSGQNDAPELSLDESGDPQTISLTDADAGATITKATITLRNGEAGDELSVNLDGTGLTSEYVNGVLTITGSATADVYQSVLQSLIHSTKGEFTIGGDRTLDIVVTDDQGTDSNSAAASVTVDAKDWSFNEDDLVVEAGNQIIGHWKPAGSSESATMSEVVMRFGGKDYTRVTPINEAGDFKITIEDTGGTPPIPVMGIIYFRADGTIELEPTEAIDFMPEGMDLSASFTYTVDDDGSITTHKFGMDVSGQNDAPELSLDESGDPQTISLSDADAGATITKATITLRNGEAGDELSVNLDGTGLSAEYVNGVLTITGSATTDVYQSVLQSLSHSTKGEFTIGGDRTLDIVVIDDQGANSNSAAASVTVDAKDWSFNEDDLVVEAGNQIIGHWKPAGSSDSASMTKVVMNFGGKDYTRETPINEAGDFKITIEDTDGAPPIPVMGIIYFRADGTIELEPTEAIDFMPEGMDLSASFTYTVENGGSTTTHTFGMKVSGQNDAPEIEFIASDSHDNASGLFGNVEITNPDMGDKINSATVTLKDGSLKDAINIDVEAIFNDFGITVTSSSEHVLTFTGEASKEDYEAALSRVYFLSEELASNRQLTLDIAVTDKAGATGKAETTITVNKESTINISESGLFSGADNQQSWKPEGMDGGKVTSVIMNFDGKDYIRDISDYSDKSDHFKITIEDESKGIPKLGALYFKPDGTIEFEPYPVELSQAFGTNEGQLPGLEATFTYTVEDNNGDTSVHVLDMVLSGDDVITARFSEPPSDYDVLNIEASNGETALLEFFSKDSETVEGIEEVSLSNAKLSFKLEDVIDITSDDNVLYISNESQGQLEEGFDSNMTNKGTVDHNDKTWQHYSYTMNNAEVNLYVEQSLTNLPENV